MAEDHSVAEAKQHLTRFLRDVERGRVVRITRRGKPIAVLLAIGEYERLAQEGPGFSSAYEEFRDAFDVEELRIEPEQVFRRDRSPTGGREFSW